MTLFLSQIRLSKTPSVDALRGLWTSVERGKTMSAQHNLLWSVFADGPDRRRDFLWREMQEGTFLTLSARPPAQLDLFEPHRVKAFAPVFRSGDCLEFQLRANATRMKRGKSRARVDVVMDRLYEVERDQRGARRMEIATHEGHAWLERQGQSSGFHVLSSRAEDYTAEVLPRLTVGARNTPRIGVLDLAGRLKVTDPVAFTRQLGRGFGRAKSFGCGLMLLQRAG